MIFIFMLMKILCILTIYNEIEYLPYKLKFCKENNLDLYVIDNISDDGSWEWLQENNVPSHRYDTNGSFDLTNLQKEIVRTIHIIKPDWVLYNGCDTFTSTDNTLYDEIINVDNQGYNVITIDVLNVFNTGESINNNPFDTFFHYKKITTKTKFIHKYESNIRYRGDQVKLRNEKITHINGIMINYGDTKSKEERMITLERRQKAWDNGEPRGHGKHYLNGNEKNWIWNKNDLEDLRNSDYNVYINKLINTL